jgi:hypothetical protein
MDSLDQHAATSLPLAVGIAGLVIWVIIARRELRGASAAFSFLYIALSARLLVNFFHQFTTRSVFAGQSITSLLTVAIIVIGALMFWKSTFRYRQYAWVFAFSAVLLFSGIYNGEAAGTINALLRETLFLVICGLVIRLQTVGGGIDIGRLLSIFTVPLFYQVASLGLRVTTNTEADGSISYIGGYVHEGVFSVAMLAGLCLAVLAPNITWRRQTTYVVIFLVSIFFANYRTAIVAALPIVFAHFALGSGRGIRSDSMTALRSLVSISAIVLGAILVIALSQRLADFGTVIGGIGDLIKPPEAFDSAQRDLLSGRVVLWNTYIFATLDGDLAHMLVGYGPDAWENTFALYAHNVFVSYIYEVGFLGLAFYCALVLSFMWVALRITDRRRWLVAACHLGFIVLSTGTMTTIVIEGVIQYAIICGFTVAFYHRSRSAIGERSEPVRMTTIGNFGEAETRLEAGAVAS